MQLSFSKVSLRNRTCVGDETTWPRLQKHDHRMILWSFCYELTCSKSLIPNIFPMMVLWWLIALGSMLVLQWGHDNSSPSLNSQSWLTVLEGRSLKSIEKNLNGFQKLIIFEVGACGPFKKSWTIPTSSVKNNPSVDLHFFSPTDVEIETSGVVTVDQFRRRSARNRLINWPN